MFCFSKKSMDELIKNLPAPLNLDSYTLLKQGIFDSEDINVYINESHNFAFLYPQPELDYGQYMPRFKSLNLSNYRRERKIVESRWEKIKPYFPSIGSVLEIGAGNGSFLAYAHEARKDLLLACIEPDQSTKPLREANPWLVEYESLGEIISNNIRFDLICLFHVFEHLLQPDIFLAQCTQITNRIIVEVPSLSDPLLALYEVEAYKDFYFQKQHPYIYSGDSVCRVLEHHQWAIEEVLPYQRYGLENHLTWLLKGIAGGNPTFQKIFSKTNQIYINELEEFGFSDTVFVVASK
jgi:hypothetical protein